MNLQDVLMNLNQNLLFKSDESDESETPAEGEDA